jgi:hypothetical protein
MADYFEAGATANTDAAAAPAAAAPTNGDAQMEEDILVCVLSHPLRRGRLANRSAVNRMAQGFP